MRSIAGPRPMSTWAEPATISSDSMNRPPPCPSVPGSKSRMPDQPLRRHRTARGGRPRRARTCDRWRRSPWRRPLAMAARSSAVGRDTSTSIWYRIGSAHGFQRAYWPARSTRGTSTPPAAAGGRAAGGGRRRRRRGGRRRLRLDGRRGGRGHGLRGALRGRALRDHERARDQAPQSTAHGDLPRASTRSVCPIAPSGADRDRRRRFRRRTGARACAAPERRR